MTPSIQALSQPLADSNFRTSEIVAGSALQNTALCGAYGRPLALEKLVESAGARILEMVQEGEF